MKISILSAFFAFSYAVQHDHFKLSPSSCKAAYENEKSCVANRVQANGVQFTEADIERCLQSCAGAGGQHRRQGGRQRRLITLTRVRREKKDKKREERKLARAAACLREHVGYRMLDCVQTMIDFDTIEWAKPLKTISSGKKNANKNRVDIFYSKAMRCGAETQTCLQSIMTDWWNVTRLPHLKQIMCNAHRECTSVNTESDNCQTQLGDLKSAKCHCMQHDVKEPIQTGIDTCTNDKNTNAIQKLRGSIRRMCRTGSKNNEQRNQHEMAVSSYCIGVDNS